jgi:hypothetical protein
MRVCEHGLLNAIGSNRINKAAADPQADRSDFLIVEAMAETHMGKWIALGVAIGVGIGAIYDNIAIGVGIGVALGIALGSTQRSKRS